MFRKGYRLLATANIVTLLVAVAHTMGSFSPPQTEGQARMQESMQGFVFNAVGMSWSMFDVLLGLAFTMTVFLVFIVAVNAVLMYSDTSRTVLSRVVAVEAAVSWILAALYYYYQIPPPFVSFVLMGVFYTAACLALLRPPGGEELASA